MRGLTFFELNNSISMFSLSAICILDKQDSHSLSFKTKLVSVNSCPQNHYGSITLEIVNVKLEKGVRTGLYRTLTSLPSWISKFLVSDNCFVSQKLCDYFMDGNEGFKNKGRREFRCPEEPRIRIFCADSVQGFRLSAGSELVSVLLRWSSRFLDFFGLG